MRGLICVAVIVLAVWAACAWVAGTAYLDRITKPSPSETISPRIAKMKAAKAGDYLTVTQLSKTHHKQVVAIVGTVEGSVVSGDMRKTYRVDGLQCVLLNSPNVEKGTRVIVGGIYYDGLRPRMEDCTIWEFD